MLPSKSSDLKHSLKLRESFENVLKVSILQAVQSIRLIVFLGLLNLRQWSKIVEILISDLENVADISKVAASIKHQKWVNGVFIIHVNLALIYKVNSRAYNVMHDDTLLVSRHIDITKLIG